MFYLSSHRKHFQLKSNFKLLFTFFALNFRTNTTKQNVLSIFIRYVFVSVIGKIRTIKKECFRDKIFLTSKNLLCSYKKQEWKVNVSVSVFLISLILARYISSQFSQSKGAAQECSSFLNLPLFSKLFAHLSQFRLVKANEMPVDANIMRQPYNLETFKQYGVHYRGNCDVINIYKSMNLRSSANQVVR